MPKLQIECPKCEGSGKIDMPEHLRETFAALKKLKSATVHDVIQELQATGFHPTAFNQRLSDLRKLGFVQRKREGKNWRYFVKEK